MGVKSLAGLWDGTGDNDSDQGWLCPGGRMVQQGDEEKPQVDLFSAGKAQALGRSTRLKQPLGSVFLAWNRHLTLVAIGKPFTPQWLKVIPSAAHPPCHPLLCFMFLPALVTLCHPGRRAVWWSGVQTQEPDCLALPLRPAWPRPVTCPSAEWGCSRSHDCSAPVMRARWVGVCDSVRNIPGPRKLLVNANGLKFIIFTMLIMITYYNYIFNYVMLSYRVGQK